MKKLFPLFILTISFSLFITDPIQSQTDTTLISKIDSLINFSGSLEHRLDELEKMLMMFCGFSELVMLRSLIKFI